jgi:hypothetical protein
MQEAATAHHIDSSHVERKSFMKFKSTLAAGLLISAFASIEAHADCALAVNPSSYIPLGQTFSFGVDIYDFSPLPPLRFTIVFFGTKNGVVDIPPTGETYPGVFGFGHYNLTGFQNPPSGGLSGNYVRYAVLYDQNGNAWCVTNAIAVTLQ